MQRHPRVATSFVISAPIDSDVGGLFFDILRDLTAVCTTRQLSVLQWRLQEPLAEVARRLDGVTREWVRQIESKARNNVSNLLRTRYQDLLNKWDSQLHQCVAVSESQLFEPWIVPDLIEAQYVIGRVCFVAAFPTAVRPKIFGRPLSGWWSLSPDALADTIRDITNYLPFEFEHLQDVARNCNTPLSIPLATILQAPVSPAIYVESINGWVHRRAKHRDSVLLLLRRSGTPLKSVDLSTS